VEFGHLRAEPALGCDGLTPPYSFPHYAVPVSSVWRPFFRLTLSSHPSPCGAKLRYRKTPDATHFKAASTRRTPRVASGERGRAFTRAVRGRLMAAALAAEAERAEARAIFPPRCLRVSRALIRPEPLPNPEC
jgi:hypothetical protein